MQEVILVLVLWSLRPPNSGKELHVETGSAKQDNSQVGAEDYSNQQLWYNHATTLKKIYLKWQNRNNKFCFWMSLQGSALDWLPH